jgi:regulator of sigma E protease
MGTIFSILFAILIFSFLIFVHELGHFLTAKLSGVQVNEFAIFMGPAIWKKQKGETLYSIRTIPIGGYCAMEGEDSDTDNPRSFQKAVWWKRLAILLAGAAMNFIAGLLLIAIVFAPAEGFVAPVVDSFTDYCTIDGENGLQVGDRFVEVDGEKIYLHSDLSMMLSLNPGDYHDIVVERNGQLVELKNFYLERHEVTDEHGNKSMLLGFSFGTVDATLGNRLGFIWNTATGWVRSVRLSLQMLLTGKAGLADMQGPVGIVGTMTDVATSSETTLDAIMNLLYFGAFIAINLAVMNLLPIPALDGGRAVALLLTTAIEAVTHKKLNPKYEGYVHAAGMLLLLGLMAVILLKDVITMIW